MSTTLCSYNHFTKKKLKEKVQEFAMFLDLNLSNHNDIVSTKNYDKRDNLILILLNFRSLMSMSLGVPLIVYIYEGRSRIT